jgi:malate dehydrogenase
MPEPLRIALTGAAGRISYALLPRIANGGMFGLEQPVELSLLDVPAARRRLDATVMELDDCALPLLRSVRTSTDPAEAFAGADWVLLLASAPYREGMTRVEALRANGPIFQEHGRAIHEAAKSARVLVVANPCNTNCLIARSVARDVHPDHWFAMTRLDQNRGRAMLARKAGVAVDQVTRVTAWGNHSPSVFADFHNAYVGDRPAHEVIRDPDWVRNEFEPGVARRGQVLREIREASPALSAAQAILGTVRALASPTPLGLWFSVAVVSDGSYDVPQGLVFSVPVRTEDGQTWSVVRSHYLDDHAQARIAANVAELGHEAAVVADLMPARVA